VLQCVLQCVAVCVAVLDDDNDIKMAEGTCRNTLQFTATHCNIMLHTSTYCNTLLGEAPQDERRSHCTTLQHTATRTATHCNMLQHTIAGGRILVRYHHKFLLHLTETHCNTLQHTATHCTTLQHTAPHCNTLQHTATHCNTLQHTTHNSAGRDFYQASQASPCNLVLPSSRLSSVLQNVAAWCSVVQCGAVWCNVVQRGALLCSVVQGSRASRCNLILPSSRLPSVMQCVAACWWCSVLQRVAVCFYVM